MEKESGSHGEFPWKPIVAALLLFGVFLLHGKWEFIFANSLWKRKNSKLEIQRPGFSVWLHHSLVRSPWGTSCSGLHPLVCRSVGRGGGVAPPPHFSGVFGGLLRDSTWAFLVAQMIKNLPEMQETQV